MATPFDAKLADLPEAERAEIAKILAERPGDVWHSDEGDGMAGYLLLALAASGGVVATLVEFSIDEILEFWTYLPYALPYSLVSPFMGSALAVIALPLLVWRFLVLHRRHGWMVTSFGLVRIRGPRLRIARWQDVERVNRRRIGGTRGFVMVELTTNRGVLECDTAALYQAILHRVPQTATAPT
jgi:hypothetical protein